MAEKKNLCAQIPLELYTQVCEAKEATDQTTKYITNLLSEYFEMKCNQVIMKNITRTMVLQIPENFFQQIKTHLERETQRMGCKLTQRKFVLRLTRMH